MILLLTVSVNVTVTIKKSIHNHPLLLKLMIANTIKKIYKGAQNSVLRSQGIIKSKKGFANPLLIKRNNW
jgi:hypothetical protein